MRVLFQICERFFKTEKGLTFDDLSPISLPLVVIWPVGLQPR